MKTLETKKSYWLDSMCVNMNDLQVLYHTDGCRKHSRTTLISVKSYECVINVCVVENMHIIYNHTDIFLSNDKTLLNIEKEAEIYIFIICL